MATATEMKTQIVTRAAEDGDFRAQLVADPKGAVYSEIGATIPEGFDVVVHEDNATTAHLVLPPSPELTEVELEAVAGAANWGPFWVPAD